MDRGVIKLKKIRKWFAGKAFTYYMTTSLMAVAFLGTLFLVNRAADKLDARWDFTQDQRYTISEETKTYIQSLDRDVKFILFERHLQELPEYLRVGIDQYVALNPKVSIVYKDIDLNPALVSQYGLGSEGQGGNYEYLVVEAGSKYRSVNLTQIMGEFSAGSGQLESKLTGAISYVLRKDEQKIYFLEGHGEYSDEGNLETILQRLDDAGFFVDTLDISTEEKVPEDASIVAILGPKNDIREEEKDKLLAYTNKGGNFFIALHPDFDDPNFRVRIDEMPNLLALLGTYGVTFLDGVILEADANYLLNPQLPFLIKPEVMQSEITRSIVRENLRFTLSGTRGLSQIENVEDVFVGVVAQTSNRATLWSPSAEATDAANAEPVNDPLAVALVSTLTLKTDKSDESSAEASQNEKKSKLAIWGNTEALASEYIYETASYGNVEMFIKSVMWLSETMETNLIAPKTFTDEFVQPTSKQAIFVYLLVIILPVLVMAVGVIVWKVRKRL